MATASAAPIPLTDGEILAVSDGCWLCGEGPPVVVHHGLPVCERCDADDSPDDECEPLRAFQAVREALRDLPMQVAS